MSHARTETDNPGFPIFVRMVLVRMSQNNGALFTSRTSTYVLFYFSTIHTAAIWLHVAFC